VIEQGGIGAAFDVVVKIVPERVVLGGHIELAQVGLQSLADALDALARLVGLDARETMAEGSSSGIEHPCYQSHRGHGGGQENRLTQSTSALTGTVVSWLQCPTNFFNRRHGQRTGRA
jgi:hypothetical protein